MYVKENPDRKKIEIHPEHRNFLVLNGSLKIDLQNIFSFVFYHSVCHQRCVFTKVLRPFTKRWRGIIKAIIYIDDGIAGSRSFKLAKTAGKLVKNNLVSAVFIINVEKSHFNPKTKRKWSGTTIDTIEIKFTAPYEKNNKFDTKRFNI